MMMTRKRQTVPRMGRKASLVPSALIFWITVVILCEQEPGVHGDCHVQCSVSYCACIGGTLCVVEEDVPETTPVGTGLFNVSVDPTDSEIRIRMITEDADDLLGVDDVEVFLNDTLDYERVTEYEFTIDCLDGDTWSSDSDMSTSLRHRLTVKDMNEFPPDFNVDIIYASIQENADIGTKLITDVPIKASDGDPQDYGFEYSIPEDAPFKITEGCQENEVFLYLNGTVDFEYRESYTITIVAEDGCYSGFFPLEGSVTVIVQVSDADDQPPAFDQDNYDVTIPERNQTFVYTGLSASDQDTLDTPLQYSFTGQISEWRCLDYLTIDPDTAEVNLTKELDYETSQSPCIITVKAVQQDNCEMFDTTELTVTVTDVDECADPFPEDRDMCSKSDESWHKYPVLCFLFVNAIHLINSSTLFKFY